MKQTIWADNSEGYADQMEQHVVGDETWSGKVRSADTPHHRRQRCLRRGAWPAARP